jgi:hypothetical protein
MSLPIESPPRPVLAWAAALDSLVLSGLFLLVRPWGIWHGLGFLFGALTVRGAILAWRKENGRYTAWAVLALSLQVAAFLATSGGIELLARLRLIQVAAIVAYLAILLSLLLTRRGRKTPGQAALWGSAIALAVWGIDAVLGVGPPPNRVPARLDWPDSADVHPKLGRVPRPYSSFKTYYSENPDSALLEEDLRSRTWAFSVMPGSEAELVLPPQRPEVLRVAIQKASPDSNWHIQLTRAPFTVEAKVPYFINFRARADRPRKAAIEFSRNHPPWSSLGLYDNIALTTEWKDFREVFTASVKDTNARLTFNLAGSNSPVEIARVELHGPPAGQKIEPTFAADRYYIPYQRNALGCRDRDYPRSRPAHDVRILALGDAFTAGVGVLEKNTFARLLDSELNDQGRANPRLSYEVINCGVSGYGTHEQLLFFQLFGATYRPDLVLVTMDWNDDQFYWEARGRESLRREPGRLEQLSSVLHKIKVIRGWTRTHEYRRCVEDLRALDQAARKQGARLVVTVSRHGPPALGDLLLATVRSGLARDSIPVLDLGTLQTADSVRDNPRGPAGPRAHRAAAAALSRWLRNDVLTPKGDSL